MFEIRELSIPSMIARIIISILLGGLLGLERGLKNRPAGLRTYMLVCLGACIVMVTNQYAYQAYGVGDPVRMGAQVVSGIGFLGAGTIIVTTRNQIKGLTTAAGLWAAACVGLSIGIGLYEVAAIGGVAIFVVLTVLHKWDFKMRKNAYIVDAFVELNRDADLGSFIRSLRSDGIEMSNTQLEREHGTDSDTISFLVTFKGRKPYHHSEILSTVEKMNEVDYVEEL